MKRIKRISVYAHAKRGIVIQIVGNRCTPIGEQGFFNRDFRHFVKVRVNLRKGIPNAKNVLRVFRVCALLNLRPIQFVRDDVCCAVPLVPFKAGVIIPALCDPGNENPFCDFGVVPCCRHKLICM